MSRKNKPEAKKLRTLERVLRKGRLPRYFNIVDYMLDRKLAKNRHEVYEMIKDKRIMAESHPIGILTWEDKNAEKHEVFQFNIPVELKSSVWVKEHDEE